MKFLSPPKPAPIAPSRGQHLIHRATAFVPRHTVYRPPRPAAAVTVSVVIVLLMAGSTQGQGQDLGINVRADTRDGLPYGGAHWAGVSDIVWGRAGPDQSVHVSVLGPDGRHVERDTAATADGAYRVAVDHVIRAGSRITVTTGTVTRRLTVPAIAATADAATQVVEGIGPPGITDLAPGHPHTLEVAIGGVARQLTTDESGRFQVDLGERVFPPGVLGVVHYVDRDRNSVYFPLWAMVPLARGEPGDPWADVVIGQPTFSELAPNKVGPDALFNPAGTYVDRHTKPNRVFVYDGGNSRVLGFDHLGSCRDRPATRCTSDADCGRGACTMDPQLSAAIVLGQPDFSGADCNGDSGYAQYPDVPEAGARTLCGLREEQMSITEGGSGATMTTDPAGGLYVPDIFNNRVLYYAPEDLAGSPDGTLSATDVWGQADFTGVHCNRGAGHGRTFADALCLGQPPGGGVASAGVDVDGAGNLWVADPVNHRVVRFPFDAATGRPAHAADLVLGQPDFSSRPPATSMAGLQDPVSVRVARDGTVYVADSGNQRVQIFRPPLISGMAATTSIVDLARPMGLELAADGSLWVVDHGRNVLFRYAGQVRQQTVELYGGQTDIGGIGVDRDDNLLTASWAVPNLARRKSPAFDVPEQLLHGPAFYDMPNVRADNETLHSDGLAVTPDQLVIADYDRLAFWNGPERLRSGAAADGFVYADNPRQRTGSFRNSFSFGPAMGSDRRGRLWASRIMGGGDTRLMAYTEPLTDGARPTTQLIPPVRLLGGGTFEWSTSTAYGSIVADPLGDRVWVVDRDLHRVFRVRDLNAIPVVDIVLGQKDDHVMACNQGRGIALPSMDSLCFPGHVAIDPHGNLYVSNNALEFRGPGTLHFFERRTLPDRPDHVAYGIPATRVIGRVDGVAAPSCPDHRRDPLCHPWQAAFDPYGHMAVGLNRYRAAAPVAPWVLLYRGMPGAPYPFGALGDWSSLAYNAAFAPDGRDLWVQDPNRNRVLKYANPLGITDEMTPIPTIVPLPTATPAAPDDLRIVFDYPDQGGTNLYTMRLDGTDMTQITFDPPAEWAARVSPKTGVDVVFNANRDGSQQAYIMRMDGSRPRRLGPDCQGSGDPSYAPDGGTIIFTCDGRLNLSDGSGENRRPLPIHGEQPDISHDGRRITYISGPDVYAANIDGTAARSVTRTGGSKYHPTWSPEDDWILYQFSPAADRQAIGMTRSDGSRTRQLSAEDAGYSDSFPRWFPAGGRILFSSDRSGSRELYHMAVDGEVVAEAVRISNNSGTEAHPSIYRPGELRTPDPTATATMAPAETATAASTPPTPVAPRTAEPERGPPVFLPWVTR